MCLGISSKSTGVAQTGQGAGLISQISLVQIQSPVPQRSEKKLSKPKKVWIFIRVTSIFVPFVASILGLLGVLAFCIMMNWISLATLALVVFLVVLGTNTYQIVKRRLIEKVMKKYSIEIRKLRKVGVE